MTSIYKTAYPYYSLRKKIEKEIIIKDYRLTHHEILKIKRRSQNTPNAQLTYAILMITFRNLNYFPNLPDVPLNIGV